MKTTVDFPEELLVEVKKRVAELRGPLGELLTEACAPCWLGPAESRTGRGESDG